MTMATGDCGVAAVLAANEHANDAITVAIAVDGFGMAATMAADEHDITVAMTAAADGCGMAATMAADSDCVITWGDVTIKCQLTQPNSILA